MEYLYVCHFSNGHIKVGRSIDPRARIAAHADRVACMGVELVEHHIAECIGRSAPAETALIERCAENATRRNKSEWFEGLDFQDARELADACACKVFAECSQTGRGNHALQTYFETQGRGAAIKLCEAVGAFSSDMSSWTKGKRLVPAERCPSIEQATNGLVRCEDLRPDVNWGVLRGVPAHQGEGAQMKHVAPPPEEKSAA